MAFESHNNGNCRVAILKGDLQGRVPEYLRCVPNYDFDLYAHLLQKIVDLCLHLNRLLLGYTPASY